MTAHEVLNELERLKIIVQITNGKLILRPAASVPPALLEAVRAVKADLLAGLCSGCHATLDAHGACWRCCNRLCESCRAMWTGSAFIAVCRPCEIEACRKQGIPY